MNLMTEIYKSSDGRRLVEVKFDLFETTPQNITMHTRSIYEGELHENCKT